ncbi:hypothetical protein E9993_03545 [Labilibacter sediminis]|nr:hypothetical protein E9993_03545 [Labilibacter sediminis]
MKKRLLALLLFSLPLTVILSQVHPTHTKKMYKSEDGKLYVNKNQPMYLFLGTDPDSAGEAQKLDSESSAKYANPFYFDTEGLNTVRTPSQIDPVTKELIYPIADVVFEVYADGVAPGTKSTFNLSKNSIEGNITYYSSSLKVALSSADKTSGTENIYFSVDDNPYQIYKDSLSFKEEKAYRLSYYSVDNVGNVEKSIVKEFSIDRTAPTSNWKLNGDVSGNTASGRSYIELMAADALSGVKNIKYQIDDNPARIYKSPIPLNLVGNGEHDFKYWVEDNVGNVSNEVDGLGGDIKVYAFIVDDVAPTASALIEGDQFAGKYLFVSSRSRCKLDGKDDLLGINKITYSFGNQKLDNIYAEPLAFHEAQGLQSIYYQSYDMVANKSNIENIVVYLDNEAPVTGIDYKGPQFFNRDTMFINAKTQIVLNSMDNASGVLKTGYVIDNGNLLNGNLLNGNSFNIEKDGFHSIKFSSIDKVNNKETQKESEVVVDNVGPELFVNFSIKPIRKIVKDGKEINVYPPFVKMYIGATDQKCGAKSIWYSIDGKPQKIYSSTGSPADVEMFKEEKIYSVVVDATDNLGNKNSKEIQFQVATK